MHGNIKYTAKTAAALLLCVCLMAVALPGCARSNPKASSSSRRASSSSALMSDNDLIGDSSSSAGSSAGTGTSKTGSTSKAGGSTQAASSSAASSAPAKVPVTVTIPEGFCVTQIAARLQANGVITDVNAFYDAVNNYNFTAHPQTYAQANAAYSSHRRFKLEGYLYPATYTFYKNMAPQDTISMMLGAFGNYAYGQYDDQTVILASIIEKEAAKTEDMQKISAVFHNRMRQGMALQADATVYYLTKFYIGPQNIVDQYKEYYNTVRRCKFPAGPICNPGARALQAAKNPYNDTSLLYFVSDSAGNYYFASTLDQQNQNIKTYNIPTGTPQTQASSN